MAKKCKYFNSGQTQCPRRSREMMDTSAPILAVFAGNRPSISQSPARTLVSFFNTCIHILIPFAVLCFIDAREVISVVQPPAAFAKHSFASCTIITAGF